MFTLTAAGANSRAFQTQPPSTAIAGVALAQQPVVRLEDAFNNLITGDNSTIVSATRHAGTGSLQGNTSIAAGGGVVTFTNLLHTVATTITIDFNAVGLVGVTSANVVVNPASAATLAFAQAPTDALAGAVISPAVTVQAQDSFGNNVPAVSLNMSLSGGTGSLSGTTSRSTDSNGNSTFSDLSISLTRTKNLTA